MSRRSKRASMREGPLSDLFRSTSEDAPDEGSEHSAAGPVADEGGALRAGPSDPSSTPPSSTPPAEEAFEDRSSRPAEPSLESSQETPPERLKRVFSEEPQQSSRRELEPIVEAPRYGREEPEY